MKHIRKIFWTLICVDVFFVILHLLFGERFDLFHLDRERNFVAYYSGTQLIAIAGLGIVSTLLSRGRAMRTGWIVVALIFFGLGFDEISELHENITYYVLAYGAGLIEGVSFFRSPTYNWLVILLPFIIVSLLFLFIFSRTVKKLNIRAHRWFLASICLFVAALLLEFVGGFINPFEGPFKLYVFEELTEMVAASAMVRALLVFTYESFQSQYIKRTP